MKKKLTAKVRDKERDNRLHGNDKMKEDLEKVHKGHMSHDDFHAKWLEEISYAKMDNYFTKAAADTGKAEKEGDETRKSKRMAGIGKALSKMKKKMNEEVQIDEDKKILNKIASLDKKIKTHQDRLSLAKERRKMRAKYHKSAQSDAESKLYRKISDFENEKRNYERSLKTEDVQIDEATAHERVLRHPAVESVDDGGKGDYFVNLKKGYHYSEQRSFGNDSAAKALKVLKHVEKMDESEINEVSSKTIDSYMKKNNVGAQIKRAGDLMNPGFRKVMGPEKVAKLEKIRDKRERGDSLARRALKRKTSVKEDVTVEETKESYHTPQPKMSGSFGIHPPAFK